MNKEFKIGQRVWVDKGDGTEHDAIILGFNEIGTIVTLLSDTVDEDLIPWTDDIYEHSVCVHNDWIIKR